MHAAVQISRGLSLALWVWLLPLSHVLGATLPPNVDEASVGSPTSRLSLELIQVPYFVGEQLILRVTVRNTSTEQQTLLLPDHVFANEYRDPQHDYRWTVGHVCHQPFVEPDIPPERDCVERFLKPYLVQYAPGESRSSIWTSHPLLQVSLDDPKPLKYGIVFSSHGLVGGARLAITLHRFKQLIGARLLTLPVQRDRGYYFVAPTSPGEFLVLGVGSWYDHERPPKVFDVEWVNRAARSLGLVRYAVVSKPDVSIEIDRDDRLRVHGTRRDPPGYVGTGWARPTKSGP